MKAFIVELPNRPGSLAAVAEALGARGINIGPTAGATGRDWGSVALTAEDDDGARSTLQANGWTFRESDVVVAALDDKPGALGAATRRLADAGVNIDASFVTGMEGGKIHFGFAVADAAAARAALGDLCVS